MLYYTTSEARKNFAEIINQVMYKKQIAAIGRRGRYDVLIVPAPHLDEEFSITALSAESKSYEFLNNEPEIYSLKDLKKRYY